MGAQVGDNALQSERAPAGFVLASPKSPPPSGERRKLVLASPESKPPSREAAPPSGEQMKLVVEVEEDKPDRLTELGAETASIIKEPLDVVDPLTNAALQHAST